MSLIEDSLLSAWQLMTALDAQLLSIVGRSLAVSGLACLLACSLGLWLGAWLAVQRFAGRHALGRWVFWVGCFHSRPWCWRKPFWFCRWWWLWCAN